MLFGISALYNVVVILARLIIKIGEDRGIEQHFLSKRKLKNIVFVDFYAVFSKLD